MNKVFSKDTERLICKKLNISRQTFNNRLKAKPDNLNLEFVKMCYEVELAIKLAKDKQLKEIQSLADNVNKISHIDDTDDTNFLNHISSQSRVTLY